MDHDHDSCDACGGPLMWLGQLGSKLWLRCQNCGLDQHRPA